MKTTTCVVVSMLLAFGAHGSALASDDSYQRGPRIGEVRAFAIDLRNKSAVADLHHAGWLEARGQLLSTREFPDLFRTVGRTWTRDIVPEDQFAIPEIDDRSQRRISSDNPFGVLGPGDLVTSGQPKNGWLRHAALSYWLFVGHDVSQTDLNTADPR